MIDFNVVLLDLDNSDQNKQLLLDVKICVIFRFGCRLTTPDYFLEYLAIVSLQPNLEITQI